MLMQDFAEKSKQKHSTDTLLNVCRRSRPRPPGQLDPVPGHRPRCHVKGSVGMRSKSQPLEGQVCRRSRIKIWRAYGEPSPEEERRDEPKGERAAQPCVPSSFRLRLAGECLSGKSVFRRRVHQATAAWPILQEFWSRLLLLADTRWRQELYSVVII